MNALTTELHLAPAVSVGLLLGCVCCCLGFFGGGVWVVVFGVLFLLVVDLGVCGFLFVCVVFCLCLCFFVCLGLGLGLFVGLFDWVFFLGGFGCVCGFPH